MDKNKKDEINLIPVMQCLEETDTSVKFRMFEDVEYRKVIPIAQACAICKDRHNIGSIEKCQSIQKQDAIARGFSKLTCPHQFEEATKHACKTDRRASADAGGRYPL